MAVVGFDTASALTPAVLDQAVADGAKFIELYVKWATPELVQLIHSKGLAIGLIWETSAERALSGRAGGLTDATEFLAMVPDKLGVMPPNSVALAWTADFDATVSQQPFVLNYGQGFKDGLAGRLRTRCYANGAICAAAKAQKIVDFTWVAGGRGMRGTAAFLNSGAEDEAQDVGDKQGLGLPISIDSDAVVGDPALPWAWWPAGEVTVGRPVAPTETASPIPSAVVMQTYLKNLNLYTGPIDGIWGDGSSEALRIYLSR